VVFTCWPFLRNSGYGLSTKEFFVVVWGGLRGALGLTLSLMVAVDTELPFRLRELTVFYMAGLASLTLLVNGTTCKSLCIYLELIENPPIKAKLLKNAK
jgi:NhaP-type Na+/H+ or K+/H+ antiporter